ncbi:DUF2750 domain-containing protein [Alicyclobacillus fodiniaquatilis]|uniref:DUF2750 domain-containing protein n=1 Tax=Alicyclobacillus fodiniaquatilis TaxID=1661150 RepID=A0ABW4JCS3_9BACL
MHEKEFNAVISLPGSKRYEYFIKQVCDRQEVWGLFNNGWAMVTDDNGQLLIPLWPRIEFAEVCVDSTEWSGYKPKEIDLERFVEKWIPGMVNDKVMPAIFMTPSNRGVAVDNKRLLEDLEQELENY